MEQVTRPIFTPLRSRFSVFGIPAGKFVAMILIAVAGAVLATLLTQATHSVEVAYDEDGLKSLYAEYTETLTALDELEVKRVAADASSYDELSLSNSDEEVIEKAEEAGIEPGMSSDDIIELLPAYQVVEEPIFPRIPTYVVLVALPVVVMFLLFVEINRTNVLRELRRMTKWSQSQKAYKSLPIDYVERETGVGYWDALAKTVKSER